jgi:glucose-6-phosphate isomerase
MASTPSSSFSIRAGGWCPAISSPLYVPTIHLPGHQEALLANCFRKSAALAFGKTEAEARSELIGSMSAEALETLLPHKVFPGNQPSSTLLLSRLDPQTLGALIALYEHKVFVQGVIWGLNSFDQWGVELGKAVASSILPAIDDALAEQLDASTRGLLKFSRQHLA